MWDGAVFWVELGVGGLGAMYMEIDGCLLAVYISLIAITYPIYTLICMFSSYSISMNWQYRNIEFIRRRRTG